MIIVKIIQSIKNRIWNPMVKKYILSMVSQHGEDINIGEGFSACGYERLYFGNHIYIGDCARFLCTNADIKIGDYVMFGPEVLIVTGNHRFNFMGEYMYNVTEKLPTDDLPVIIEDDVWIGARAIILKGSKIGTGSIVAAGAVVSGEVPSYSIYYGKNKIRARFSDEELQLHLLEMNKKKVYYNEVKTEE